MTLIAFARQSAEGSEHVEHSGERLVGMYAQPHPDMGVGRFILAPDPGLTQFATLAAGKPVRAVYVEQGMIYAACGGRLWRVTAAGVATDIGGIADGETTLAGNGLQVTAAAGGRYYVWDGTTVSAVTPGAFTAAGSVTKLDNYIIISEQGGQRFSYSGLAAAASVDALDFASAESAPDHVVRVLADHSELWFFGTKTTEVWGNTGGGDLPFSRMSGGVIERGCAFATSIAKDDNSVFWVGDDRMVYRAVQYVPQVISVPWVNALLQSAPEAQAFCYTHRNHKFYALRVPGHPTLIYDAATGLWHERAGTLDYTPWRAMCADRIDAATIVGGSDGKLYTLGGVTDGGDPVLREGVSLPINDGERRVGLHNVVLDFRTGATDLGRNAQVMIQHSRDGRTWGRERWRSLGRLGEYSKRVSLFGFGVGRQHRIRFRITDPVETALYGASVAAS